MNYNNYIGCAIEYENKSGNYIMTELSEGKAKMLNESPEIVKKNSFKAYKEVGKMTELELRLVFPNGFRRLKKGIFDKKNKRLLPNCYEMEVTKTFDL